MILDIIWIFLVVCILFSFCLFPLFIAMGVNASHKILDEKEKAKSAF